MSEKKRNGGNNTPCLGCTKRFEACQDVRKCPEYKAFREKLDKRNENERRYIESLNTMSHKKIRDLWKRQRYQRSMREHNSMKAD